MAEDFLFPVADLMGDQGRRRQANISTDVDWRLELSAIGPRLEGEIMLESAVGGIVARGAVATSVTHTCHRCLTEWEEPVRLTLTEVLGMKDDDDGYPVDDGVADLEPPIRDAVILALPLTPTCREDCRGLCAVCGADLNTGPCPGHAGETDSPFASLRGLLDTRDSGKG